MYLGLHIATNIGMALLQKTLYKSYLKYEEARADAFANQYVDDTALLGGKKFFEEAEECYKTLPNDVKIYTYFDQRHPTNQSRIKAINKEIERRKVISEKIGTSYKNR
jgi:hypothetical protein